MKILNIKLEKIIRLYFENDYIIEIINEEQTIEFWLYKKGYGIKDFMFGIENEGQDLFSLANLAETNIKEYIEIYKNEYED